MSLASAARPQKRARSRRTIKERNKLVERNMGFAWSIARKLARSRGISEEDAVQAALLGMTRAAELYDASRGFRFTTYSRFRIVLEINRAASKSRGGAYVSNRYLECGLKRDADEATKAALADPVEYPEVLVDPKPPLDELVADKERKDLLRALIAHLPPRWKAVIAMRYLGAEDLTLGEVGRRLGISRQYADAIEVRALRSMRMMLQEWSDGKRS